MAAPTRACILWFVLVAGGAGVADAGPRYPRDPAVRVDPTPRTPRPAPPKPAAGAPKPVSATDVLAALGDAQPIREEQIALLKGLIADTPDSEPVEKADLHYRVAELYAQRERFHRLEATEDDIAAGAGGPDAAARRTSSQAHARDAKRALAEAIASYRAIADRASFRVYPRMDRALFALAYALQQQQGPSSKDARQVWKRILDEHPQSEYVSEAHLAFADYFFGAGELANAETFYRKVLQFPRSRVYLYANYRLGWVYLNLDRAEDAGRQFLQVVRDTQGDAAQTTLHAAAKKDFVRAFADFGQVGKAWATFARLDRAGAPRMQAALADLYLEQGKSAEAIVAYRELVAQAPQDPELCVWQARVAHAMLSAPGATDADKVAEIERLVKLHGAVQARNLLPPAAARACRDEAAAMAGDHARVWHDEGHRTRNPATLAHAARLYDAYLAAFPDAPDAGETQYFAAELRWLRAELEPDARARTQRWEEAADAFTDVVRAGKADRKRLAESACAAVLGWKNALDVDPRRAVDPAPAYDEDAPPPPPRPIPARVQRMLEAFEPCIAATPPADDERVGMMFLRADTLRRLDHLDRALPLLTEIVDRHAAHETAYYAANIVLDILIVTHRHDALHDFAKGLAARPAFFTARPDQDRAGLRARLGDIARKGERDRAQALERAAEATGDLGKFVACGEAYLAIFNADPEAPRSDEVLYSAGVCFEQGRSLSTAQEAYGELRVRFPDSPHAARALARLGGIYARIAYYDRAAASFEEYARKHAGAQDAYDLMNDAVLYRKGIGDDAQAIADTHYFIAKFARQKPAAAADAFWSLAAIHEKRGDRARIVDHYREYLRRYRAHGGLDKVVIAHDRIGQLLWDGSCPVATVDGACIRVERERALVRRGARVRTGVREQCGPDSKIKLTVVERDRGAVKAAQAAFAAAVAAYEGAGGRFPGGDERLARYHYAQARFFQAERDYEAFLADAFPRDLSFDPARPAVLARDRRRFDAWYRGKDQQAARVAAQYTALVAKVKDPATAIAAAARFGQVQQHFADALYTAPIPAHIRAYEDAVDAYCEVLEERAEPLEAAALVGFGRCLEASTQLGWFSSWSKACERELGQIRPDQYPTAAELRAAPIAEPSITDVEPALAALR